MRVRALTSSKDPLFRRLRTLRTAQGRRELNEWLVEEEEAVRAALAAGREPSALLATEAYLAAPPAWLTERPRSVIRVSAGLMHKLFPTGRQPRVVCALPRLERPLADAPAGGRLLVLEDIQDAGNLGTLLRTAAGLGVPDVVVLASDQTDLYNRVAVRASMGALFRVRLWSATLQALQAHCAAGDVPLVCTTPHCATDLARFRPGARWALVVGNETAGVTPALRAAADHSVRIEMAAGTESLNVAVAAGIALYALVHASAG